MMNMSAKNAKHAKSTYKNKGSFASLALFADAHSQSEIRERKAEACALFPSNTWADTDSNDEILSARPDQFWFICEMCQVKFELLHIIRCDVR